MTANKTRAAEEPERLAAELRSIVTDLTQFFLGHFGALVSGQLGTEVQRITIGCFDSWLTKSNYPHLSTYRAVFEESPRISKRAQYIVQVLSERYGTPRSEANEVADFFVAAARSRSAESRLALQGALRLLRPQLANYLAQTAHVVMGRILLYRVAEDEDVLPRAFSGAALTALRELEARGITSVPPVLERLVSQRAELERFVPTVYTYGEFDWWLITAEKRAVMQNLSLAELAELDRAFSNLLLRILGTLDKYAFDRIGFDLWHEVYQHYLPADDRQRLGGFYTPEPVVREVLDEADYTSESAGLCERDVLDPACGSGTFTVVALRRLLTHLETDAPCHHSVYERLTDWEQQEAILEIVSSRLHALDIHPFATFLTTVNLFFQLLRRYLEVKRHNTLFTLELHVLSVDSLDREQRIARAQTSLFAAINSRIALSEDAYRQYKHLLTKRFDLVVGNPPWGSILKGRLAPVYDEQRKDDLLQLFPISTTGKFDIYACFIELAVKISKPGGVLALVTQNTFLEKDWAKDLRGYLVTETELRSLVDLGRHGSLMFAGALNAPLITVARRLPVRKAVGKCVIITTDNVVFERSTKKTNRVARLVAAVRSTRKRREAVGGATYEIRSSSYFRDQVRGRWDLRVATTFSLMGAGPSLGHIYAVNQGVTPGGRLDLYLLKAGSGPGNSCLVKPAFKSKNLVAFLAPQASRDLVFPYVIKDGSYRPAFKVDHAILRDALDFTQFADEVEQDYAGLYTGGNLRSRMLEHRIAIGLVTEPEVARYLVAHYEELSERIFDKKNLRQLRKAWYEYHRTRDVRLFTSSHIVSPTLIKRGEGRFTYDRVGLYSDHAALIYWRHGKRELLNDFALQQLANLVNSDDLELQDLAVLAWLNSAPALRRIAYGKQETAMGSISIASDIGTLRLPHESNTDLNTLRSIVRRVKDGAQLDLLRQITFTEG
jgi:hypothetical protein